MIQHSAIYGILSEVKHATNLVNKFKWHVNTNTTKHVTTNTLLNEVLLTLPTKFYTNSNG